MLQQGPGLVSKFIVPVNFTCSPPSSDLKERWPALAPYYKWDEIPASLIPPRVARFTTWNEPADSIPLAAPSDAGLKAKERALNENWNQLLLRSARDDDSSTAVTASMPVDSSSFLADNGSQGTPSERSSNENTPIFNFIDGDCKGGDRSHFFDDDDDNSSSVSYEDHERGEGDEELHAMILLGHHIVDGSGYWLLQNSWEGPTQIVEVSTEYFIESDAYLYFYKKDSRSPKPEHQWGNNSNFFARLPLQKVANSSGVTVNIGQMTWFIL